MTTEGSHPMTLTRNISLQQKFLLFRLGVWKGKKRVCRKIAYDKIIAD